MLFRSNKITETMEGAEQWVTRQCSKSRDGRPTVNNIFKIFGLVFIINLTLWPTLQNVIQTQRCVSNQKKTILSRCVFKYITLHVMDTIFWLSPLIESCNWIYFISVAYASWYHWNCGRTQRKAASINQLACSSYNHYVQLLWYPMYTTPQ